MKATPTKPSQTGSAKDKLPETKAEQTKLTKTGTQSAQLALIKKLYEAFSRNDIPYLLENVHPEFKFRAIGKNGIPYAGEYSESNLKDFFRKLNETYQFTEFRPEKFFELGNEVVVRGYLRGNAVLTGKLLESKWVMCFEFKDDKPVLLQDYYDTLNAYKALY